MFQVICVLPNASDEINGVKFEKTDDGMLSEVVSKEVADNFAKIDGYKVVESDDAAVTKTAKKDASGK